MTSSTAKTTSGSRCLLFANSVWIRDSLTAFFARAGIDLDTRPSHPEALSDIDQVLYDVVMMDVDVKELLLLPFVQRIRHCQPDAKLVVFSADERQEPLVTSLGVDAFIRKPITTQALRDAVGL